MDTLGLLGGFALGIAGSLHCAGMCGGIAGGLMLALGHGARGRLAALALAQAGRVAAYVLAGALLGALGSAAYGLFDQRMAFAVLQALAALVLAGIGLSLTGLVPAPAELERGLLPIGRWLAAAEAGLARHGRAGAVLGGLVWGFMPCGMVYGALFYALLTGSAGGGALVMLGFGLGTLPAVTLAALGLGWLRRAARRPALRIGAGLALIALAPLGLLVPHSVLAALC